MRRDVVETRIEDRFGVYGDPITVTLGTDAPVLNVSKGDIKLRRVTVPDEEARTSEVPVDQELQPVLHFDHR